MQAERWRPIYRELWRAVHVAFHGDEYALSSTLYCTLHPTHLIVRSSKVSRQRLRNEFRAESIASLTEKQLEKVFLSQASQSSLTTTFP